MKNPLLLRLVPVLFLALLAIGILPAPKPEEKKAEIPIQVPLPEIFDGPQGMKQCFSALMGSSLTLMAKGEPQKLQKDFSLILNQLASLEKTISSWVIGSETQKLNQLAGKKALTLSEPMLNLLRKSLEVYEESRGAFDITLGPVLNLYDFKAGISPNPLELKEALRLVSSQAIQLGKTKAYLEKPGMKINFGAIGKGYAVDLAIREFQKLGYTQYAIDLGGNLGFHTQSPLKIALYHPEAKERLLAQFELKEGYLATSGVYEQSFLQRNRRIHHILDPRTGLPVQGLMSVTVLAENATDADAYATAFLAGGYEKSLAILKNHPRMQALFVLEDSRILKTPGFHLLEPEPLGKSKTETLHQPSLTPSNLLKTNPATLNPREVSNQDFMEFYLIEEARRRSFYSKETPLQKTLTPRYWREFRPPLFRATEASSLAPFDQNTFRKPNHPVVGVDWYDADAYCRFRGERLPELSHLIQIATGEDKKNTWAFGPDFEYAKVNSGGEKWGEKDGYLFTAPVDSFADSKTKEGILNLSGNVGEWTQEGFVYGGGFRSNPTEVSSKAYVSRPKIFRAFDIGFRCARPKEKP